VESLFYESPIALILVPVAGVLDSAC